MGFRDLQRYPAQKARYDKYKEWLEATPEQRQQKFKAITDESKRVKTEREKGYVSPFNTAGTVKVYVPARLVKSGQTGQGAGVADAVRNVLSGYVSTQTEMAALTNPLVIETNQYKFAKLTLTAVVPGTSKKNSRITGALYLKPDVDSVSCAFGQKTGGQDYDVAVTEIKAIAAFKTFTEGNNGKNRYKFTPEG